MIAGRPAPWTLDVACATMAAAFTDVDRTDEVLERLDDLAEACAEPTLAGVLGAMRGRLTGNVEDYYDTRNSYIDVVLERGVGLPITLGVIAIELGRRVGAPIVGIGPPRHFMVRHETAEEYGDPFHDGLLYDRPALQAAWPELVGDVAFDDVHVAPMPERGILIRMLNNLRTIFLARSDVFRLYPLAKMRAAFPELAAEAPDRARWVAYWN